MHIFFYILVPITIRKLIFELVFVAKTTKTSTFGSSKIEIEKFRLNQKNLKIVLVRASHLNSTKKYLKITTSIYYLGMGPPPKMNVFLDYLQKHYTENSCICGKNLIDLGVWAIGN